MRTPHLGIVTALGRQIDRQVCAGSIANAARSVHQDRERADERRDAWLAVQQVQQVQQVQSQPGRSQGEPNGPRALPRPRRTG
jgi:hypothetical protein